MADVFKYPVFFELPSLQLEHMKKVETSFQLKQRSGGGDCGLLKSDDSIYSDSFKVQSESAPKRIVLLGKTGFGKSSLANTIFGEKFFTTHHAAKSGTSRCQAETRSIHGRNITLVDTPGLLDTERTEKELKSEIVRCITECSPGPHAFLIVLKVERFTEQEEAVVSKICSYFSEEALKYAVIVFTHGDQLHEGMTIEEFVSKNKKLSDLVQKCGGRCHVIDNKYWKKNQEGSYRCNQIQVEKLLHTIDKMVMENNGGCYTKEMFQAAEKVIPNEEMRQTYGDLTPEQINTQAKAQRGEANCVNVSGSRSDQIIETGNAALQQEHKKKIERYFQIKQRSGGGECGPLRRIDSNTYSVAFKDQSDQQRVLQKSEHVVDGLVFTVRDSLEPGSSSPVRVDSASVQDFSDALQQEEAVHQPDQESTPKRIVLLGKTGSGKSNLANTMFGEKLFTTHNSPVFGTSRCQAETRSVHGRKITLIDTPGLFATDRSEESLKPEIVRCLTECSPGPHAFLIVLKVERFTEEEEAVVSKIWSYFSEDALKYAVIVFTHGDQLPEGMTIEEFVGKNKKLSELVQKCGGRCHVIDNKYWENNEEDEYRNNRVQVEKLLNTIDKMVMKNNGGYYTNEMLQKIERKIQKEVELIRQTSGDPTGKKKTSGCCLI